jgi:hypothetical protein
MLLHYWAYERAGAPRGYRTAAVKAVAAVWPDLSRVGEAFTTYYHGKPNRASNPVMDSRISDLCVPDVVALIEKGDVRGAFNQLRLNGVGHKIKSFFVRDMVLLTGSGHCLHTVEDYLYCQPIDVWVRMTINALNPLAAEAPTPIAPSLYGLDPYDCRRAAWLTQASLEAGASPLRVNQGVWYFCANVVGDSGRLNQILAAKDPRELQTEMALLDGCLP